MSENYKLYKDFFDYSPDLLCVASPNGYFMKVNQACTNLLGWSEQEMVDRPYMEFVHPEDVSRSAKAVQDISTNLVTVGFRNRFLKKDGNYITMSWTATYLPESQSIIARGHDVEFYESVGDRSFDTRFLRQLIDAIADPIFVKDSEHRWILTNKAFSKILNMEPAEYLGKSDYDLFPSSIADGFWAKDDLVLKKGITNETEETLPGPNGSTRHILTKKSPAYDRDGKPLLIGIIRDITDRKEQAKQLEIERARSMYASKMAALGEISGNIAHEINNPLAVIHGYASKLQRAASRGEVLAQEELNKFTEKILNTSERIASIVKTIRQVARDGREQTFEPVLVGQLLKDIVDFFSFRTRELGIEFTIDQVPDDFTIKVQPVQFTQVLVNLVHNACDAAEKTPSPFVHLGVEKANNRVRFLVTDSGNGIPKELHSKIMTPFFTTKPIGKGTGLGLSISQNIVAAHNGSLQIDEKHPNTRFVVTIPLH